MNKKRLHLSLAAMLISIGTYGQVARPETFEQIIPQSTIRLQMVGIPAGTFQMGDAKSKASDDKPVLSLQISAFYMSEIEITHDLFMLFRDSDLDLDAEGAPRRDGVTRPSAPYEDPVFGMGKNGFPAAGMTQFGALQFCKWLSEKTGRFFRLPTEAEWEYACRAGTQTPYFFGKKSKELSRYGWHQKNSNGAFQKVRQLQPNPWGLYDILGNVSEWTLDQYQADYYATLQSGATDPWRVPTDLHPRSVRGGSFRDDPKTMTSGRRIESNLDWKKRDPQIPKSFWWNTDSPFVGFRVVSPAEQPDAAQQQAFWEMVLGG